jgi:hypothetical protein
MKEKFYVIKLIIFQLKLNNKTKKLNKKIILLTNINI